MYHVVYKTTCLCADVYVRRWRRQGCCRFGTTDIVDEDYSESTFVHLITLDIVNKTLGSFEPKQKGK